MRNFDRLFNKLCKTIYYVINTLGIMCACARVYVCVCACVCACVRSFVSACVHACVRARACVRACVTCLLYTLILFDPG